MKAKILVVDDVDLNREILNEILSDDYEVLEASNGEEALEIINREEDNLAGVLLDLQMPVMNGFEVLESMKRKGMLKRIPIIIITAEGSIENERHCYDYGVMEFIRKPFDGILVKLRVGNVVALNVYKNHLEDKVAEQTDELQVQNRRLKEQAEKLASSNQRIIEILGNVVESRNLESGQHVQRVKKYTEILARTMMENYPEYTISQEYIDVIVAASALHDVGKVAIPDSILLKPGKLTKEEFDIMKTHTTEGCKLIQNIEDVWSEEYERACYEICRHHHERFDGRGYPDGLVGDEIPLAAQIVSIADVYDALVHERVYKDAYSSGEAFRMIISGECGVFSPKLLECFIDARYQLEEVND